MSKSTITQKANQIRLETEPKMNTGSRVANVLDDINETKIDKADADSTYTKNNDFQSFKTQIQGSIVAGVKAVLKPGTPYDPTTNPYPTPWVSGNANLYEKYDVNAAGSFPNTKKSDNTPVVVTQEELDLNDVQIWVSNGISQKVLKAISQSKISEKFNPDTETEAQGGKQIAERYDPALDVLSDYLPQTLFDTPIVTGSTAAWANGQFYNTAGGVENNQYQSRLEIILSTSQKKLHFVGRSGGDSVPANMAQLYGKLKNSNTVEVLIKRETSPNLHDVVLDITKYDKLLLNSWSDNTSKNSFVLSFNKGEELTPAKSIKAEISKIDTSLKSFLKTLPDKNINPTYALGVFFDSGAPFYSAYNESCRFDCSGYNSLVYNGPLWDPNSPGSPFSSVLGIKDGSFVKLLPVGTAGNNPTEHVISINNFTEIIVNRNLGASISLRLADAIVFSEDTVKKYINSEDAKLRDLISSGGGSGTSTGGISPYISLDNDVKTGGLVFIDDDNPPAVYTDLVPFFLNKDIPFGIALTKTFNDTPERSQSVIDLHKTGMVEFLNHSTTHPHLAALSYDQQLFELKTCHDYLKSLGVTPKGYVSPHSSFNKDSLRIISDLGYECHYRFDNHLGINTLGTFYNYSINRANYGSDWGGGSGSVDQIKSLLDGCFANNNLLVIGTHYSNNNTPNWFNGLTEIINYARQKGVRIMKPHDAFMKFKNIIEISNGVRLNHKGDWLTGEMTYLN